MKRLLKNILSMLGTCSMLIGSSLAGAADKDIVDTAVNAGSFKTLGAALQAADLVGALKGVGPFTVFAPTDEAFAKLPAGTVENLLKPENKSKLAGVLKYHVVAGRVYSEDALAAKVATTLQGSTVSIMVKDGKARVNGANLVATDIDASNGVIHVIDAVILPPEPKKVSALDARQMILNTIAQGASTYNAGHHEACVQLYMTTMSSLVSSHNELPADVLTNLNHVMSQAQNASCSTDRAWTLRHGLDQAYNRMLSTR